MTEIELPQGGGTDRELWEGLGDLVELLPSEWVLIGGLMVQLHALERAAPDVRATRDIDVLGQGRPQRALPAIDAALRRAGFQPAEPDLDNYAFRYVRDDLIVDVLAPDGLKPAPRLDASRSAIGVPGGSQALARAETVTSALTVDQKPPASRRTNRRKRSNGPTTTGRRTTVPSALGSGTSSTRLMRLRLAAQPEAEIKIAYESCAAKHGPGSVSARRGSRAAQEHRRLERVRRSPLPDSNRQPATAGAEPGRHHPAALVRYFTRPRGGRLISSIVTSVTFGGRSG
jgi:hypothetical protein